MTPAELSEVVLTAVRAAVEAGELAVTVPAVAGVERPRNKEHGDYATNIALRLAKEAHRPPRDVAELIAVRLRTSEGILEAEVAGPGFLNLHLADAALGELARSVVLAGRSYGRTATSAGLRVNLEFVSANPTGPIHIGAVRWAALGDALGRLLEATGASVTREYYFNDAGRQIDLFAASLLARARQAHGYEADIPEGGYQGDYIVELAAELVAEHPGLPDDSDEKALEVLRREGVARMRQVVQDRLEDFGVSFDVWFLERSLYDSGAVFTAIDRLRDQGHVYEADSAVWLRSSDFGDDKDRVLVRSDGSPTYFAGDAAYYIDKRDRGFDRVVIMLGADHHGYVNRLRAMATCFGDDPDVTLELLIGQLVNLIRDGSPVRMSKRTGTVVTLDDLVEAVGVDAARYSLARASADTMLDLDLDLLTRRDNENPVFYVQYAHARISSLLRNAGELGLEPVSDDIDALDLSLLSTERESALLRALGEFPRVVASAADLRAPHRVARFLEELAGVYHRFYDSCRVLPQGDEEATALTRARLLLCEATRVVLANGLQLLGVSAPARM